MIRHAANHWRGEGVRPSHSQQSGLLVKFPIGIYKIIQFVDLDKHPRNWSSSILQRYDPIIFMLGILAMVHPWFIRPTRAKSIQHLACTPSAFPAEWTSGTIIVPMSPTWIFPWAWQSLQDPSTTSPVTVAKVDLRWPLQSVVPRFTDTVWTVSISHRAQTSVACQPDHIPSGYEIIGLHFERIGKSLQVAKDLPAPLPQQREASQRTL